jgi:hypothetical protein
MRNVSDKSCRQNQNTHFMFPKIVSLWDNVEKYGRAEEASDDIIIRCVRFACWITKATDTHSECVICIAVPRQQWLRERALVLRYTYIVLFVIGWTALPCVVQIASSYMCWLVVITASLAFIYPNLVNSVDIFFAVGCWRGYAVAQLVEALRYKPEGRRFDYR